MWCDLMHVHRVPAFRKEDFWRGEAWEGERGEEAAGPRLPEGPGRPEGAGRQPRLHDGEGHR